MIAQLINLLIYVLIVGLIITVVFWVIDHMAMPEPTQRLVRVVVAVIAALIVILLLLQLTGVAIGPFNQPVFRP
jgi:uncharacterized BrkB/YihY/UPF0761 family membrane protein